MLATWVAITNNYNSFKGKLKTHPLHDVLVDRFSWLRIRPVHSDLVVPQHHFPGYQLTPGHRGRPMILELDEDEAAIEAAIVRARVQIDIRDVLQHLGQLRHELRLGLVLGDAAEEEATVVHGLNHADMVARTDLVAVETRAGLAGDPRRLVGRERVAARRPGEIQHQTQLQKPAHLLQHRHQLVLVAVARQPA